MKDLFHPWLDCFPMQYGIVLHFTVLMRLSPDGRGTHDALISEQMCYHCATEAYGYGENKKNYILNLRIVFTEKMNQDSRILF